MIVVMFNTQRRDDIDLEVYQTLLGRYGLSRPRWLGYQPGECSRANYLIQSGLISSPASRASAMRSCSIRSASRAAYLPLKLGDFVDERPQIATRIPNISNPRLSYTH